MRQNHTFLFIKRQWFCIIIMFQILSYKFICRTNYLCGVTSHANIVRNRMRDNRTCRDQHMFPDADTWHNQCVRPYITPIPNSDSPKHVKIRIPYRPGNMSPSMRKNFHAFCYLNIIAYIYQISFGRHITGCDKTSLPHLDTTKSCMTIRRC